jgi:hypothetical protein
MKIHLLGAELFLCGQTAGQTHGGTDGHDEANSGFSQFCKRPKNSTISFYNYDLHRYSFHIFCGLRSLRNYIELHAY